MNRTPVIFVLLWQVACLEAPRQDLRDQNAMGIDPVVLPSAQQGMAPPVFTLAPGAEVQRIRVEVQGLQAGWLQIHERPTFLASMLGLAPQALHVQSFDRPVFTVEAPADLRATVLLEVSNFEPGPHRSQAGVELVAIGDPVRLAGGELRVSLVAEPVPSAGAP